jgi:galactokinase
MADLRAGASDEQARAVMKMQTGLDADAVASAPGRVNLIGEHVDHRGGVVLPFAIDRRISVAASVSADGRTRVIASDLGRTWTCDGPPPRSRLTDPEHAFVNHVLGVLASMPSLAAMDVPPVTIAIAGDLPIGAGVSSSAALEVAVGLALSRAFGHGIPDVGTLATAARRAEHDFVGTPCGMMDMLASAAGRPGHVLRIDCATHEITVIPAPDPGRVTFALIDSGVRHRLADGGYASRLAALDRVERTLEKPLRHVTLDDLERASLDPADRRRARHVITECDRVRTTEVALRTGDPDRIGRLLFEAHDSLRDDLEVSVPEVDAIVEAARDRRGEGVLGARIIGGGFGGSVLVMADRGRSTELLDAILAEVLDGGGRPGRPIIVQPSDGARIESTHGEPVSYPRGGPEIRPSRPDPGTVPR